MSNIIILGTGYISSKIRKYWDNDDYNLIYCSQKEDKYLTHLDDLINEHKPVFVVNCYGFTGKPNVDSCENHVEECHQRNVKDTYNIMRTCQEMGVDFITVSTGCVYNDELGGVFSEDDPHNFGHTNPTASVYSKSKSWFEMDFRDTLIKDNPSNRNYLLRIRMPFDGVMDDKNYINKIIKYDKLVNYPNSVTYVPSLVDFIEIIIKGDVESGVYNVVNKGSVRALDVIRLYNKYSGSDKSIDKWYTTDDLMSEGLMKCRRSNCVLSTSKIEKYYPHLLSAEFAVEFAIRENDEN
jgi:3,5-epimerase/4-reductase